MTPEEKQYYFGSIDENDFKDSYDVGILRKVKNNQILTRVVGTSESNTESEEYVFEAMGSEINLKMQKNTLLGKGPFNLII